MSSFTISTVRLTAIFIVSVALSAGNVRAQTAPAAQEQKPGQPQVRVNYLNVCSPSDEEKAEISAALDRLPTKPKFAVDYEISRGRSTMDEGGILPGQNAKMSDAPASVSRWVRVRKEFPNSLPLMNVQYSFSVNEDKATETLVFRSREPKDVMQVSLSDGVVAPPVAWQVVTTSTPVDRIRLERFGKSSVVLARCPTADQSKYEPLFQKATSILSLYRSVLGVKTIVPRELPGAEKSADQKSPAKPKTAH